jgi:tRNA(Ile)-lysidine synthase
MQTEHPLESRVRRHLPDLGLTGEPTHLLVALSGGCDSVVLLYLLRFRLPSVPLRLTAAHLDHAMRRDSAEDAAWVRGLCAAWDVPLFSERLATPPGGETEARRARYAFLERCADAAGAALISTAHHADDQAETILFRALRGTGLKGLAGIAPYSGRLLRPLLPFWRRELEEYARDRGLRWRTDPTNEGLDPPRNRLRHDILPRIERHVAPSARRALVSLGALAGEAEEALERLADRAEADLVRWEEGVPVLARDRLRTYDSAIATRVVRKLLRRFGVVLGRTGTRRALEFITGAPSGRQIPISGALRVAIEFDDARFLKAAEVPPERTLRIGSADEVAEGEILIGGRRYRVRFGKEGLAEAAEADRWSMVTDPSTLAFPLELRGWRDGDRLRTPRGARSLKRIFLDERVPRARRRRLPLLVDAEGEVLWVAGISRGALRGASPGGESFILTVLHD